MIGKYIVYGILGVVGLGAAVILVNFVSTVTSVATAPGRVISRTMETNNIINNYEWYHDAYAQYRSRVAQATEHKTMLAQSDNQERQRLATELSAIRQSCRDLATRYNANATKTNRSIFMGREAPESLSMEKCDQ